MEPVNKNQDVAGCYLEIYIKDDGSMIFTPVTNSTSPVLDAFSKGDESVKKRDNSYCG